MQDKEIAKMMQGSAAMLENMLEVQYRELLDAERLNTIMAGNPEGLKKMVGAFSAKSFDSFQHLNQALQEGDFERIEKISQSLKGTVSNFTTRKPFEAVADLELHARQKSLADVENSVVLVKRQFIELQHVLRRLAYGVQAS